MALPEQLVSGVECGWIVVPERYDMTDSRSVRLAWARARATGPRVESDPVAYIFGGPGAPALERAPGLLRRASWQRIRQQRDLLFLDIRGAGYSDPAVCMSVDEVVAEHDVLVLRSAALDTLLIRAVEECADSATNGGYDPAAYNSPSAARDLDELRKLLGYERWNVYGVSYGGRIAQVLMRDRPQTIRSVVLDAPVSLGVRWSRTLALREALDEFFRQCSSDPECNGAYPDLEARFEQLLEQLDASPLPLRIGGGDPSEGHFIVTRESLVRFVHRSLFEGVTTRVLPALIWEASEGHDQALLSFLPEMLEGPYQSALAEGLSLSVVCYDEAETTPQFLGQVSEQHPLLTMGGWWDARVYPLCERLHSGRATETEFNPVDTGLPTLVLGGGLDPTVAPSMIRAAAEVESGATLAMAMAAGHGVATLPCGGALVSSFFEDPSAPLDLSCLDDHAVVPFATDVLPVAGMARFSAYVGLLGRGGRAPVGGIAMQLWLMVSTLVLLLAPPVWAVLWLRRRAQNRGVAYSPGESQALWLGAATCAVGVFWTFFFVQAINRTLAVSGRLFAVGLLESRTWVVALPWVLTVSTAALALTAVAAWRRGYWGRRMRVYYGLVACGALALASFIWYWGLV